MSTFDRAVSLLALALSTAVAGAVVGAWAMWSACPPAGPPSRPQPRDLQAEADADVDGIDDVLAQADARRQWWPRRQTPSAHRRAEASPEPVVEPHRGFAPAPDPRWLEEEEELRRAYAAATDAPTDAVMPTREAWDESDGPEIDWTHRLQEITPALNSKLRAEPPG